MTPFTFDAADMLMAILLAAIIGFSCGVWSDLEDKRKKRRLLGRTMGEIVEKTASERGIQVIRSMGLSAARNEGNDEEGRLSRFWGRLKIRKPKKLKTSDL